ncbi:MAG: PhoH family protein [Fusobacteriaceae bacterium]
MTRKYSNSESEYKFIEPITPNQKLYQKSLNLNTITICSGCAGTGKTLLALQKGLKLYKEGKISKIYYIRNNCGMADLASKGRGDLPGDVLQKALPLLGPIVDNLFELLVDHKAKYMVEKGVIEPLYYEDLRGRSFSNSFLLADEAQSVTPKGILTLLTRIGEGTKLALIGDKSQKDTASNYSDGLSDAIHRLEGMTDLGIIFLNESDIQRHGIIKDIISRYQS